MTMVHELSEVGM